MPSWQARWCLAACGLVAASACAGDTPSAPSPQASIPPLKLLSISWEVPSVINIGDAPFTIQPRILISDGVQAASLVAVSKVKCNATWSSSEPSYATVIGGVLEAKAIGDTTIAFTCRELRVEKHVRVRRRLNGTVIARDTTAPIAGAFVSIISGSDAGAETRTDAAGRFTLNVPAEVDLQASAVEFDAVRLHIEPTQPAVLLTLEPLPAPSPLTFGWDGWFERLAPYPARANRLPAGTPEWFEFETHHAGEFSLAVSTSCRTNDTYDSFGALIVDDRGQYVMNVASFAAEKISRISKTLPPRRYQVLLSPTSLNAMPPCTWTFELTRPR